MSEEEKIANEFEAEVEDTNEIEEVEDRKSVV